MHARLDENRPAPAVELDDRPLTRVGTVIDGKYELLDFIGGGTTGSVYRAQNRWAGRQCAVKVFHYEGCNEGDVLRRFVREAQAIHRVQKNGRLHPHVVDALDVGRDRESGEFFVVEELLRGETLASYLHRIDGHKLSLHNTLLLLRPVIDAIACAHEAGVVHRDLKPDNLFLTRDDAGNIFPKVLDFGIAQFGDERVTPVNELIGTPQYMPPEAFGGAGFIDARADVWALGVILYEMLSGDCPFAPPCGDAMECMRLVTNLWPPSLAALGVASTTVWNVVRKATTKAPSNRYANARELLTALELALMPVRTLRVTGGMSIEQVQRALRDPGQQPQAGQDARRSSPPSAPPDRRSKAPSMQPERFSMPPGPRSMIPGATVFPLPANDVPEGRDPTFTGDPADHWWSVQFQASDVTAERVAEVLALPELANVVELHVAGCALGDAGVRVLVDSPYLRNLNVLVLRKVGMTARGAECLAATAGLGNLIKLDLEGNALGSDGLRAVLAGRHFANLRSLSAVNADLDASAAEAVVSAARLASLQRLDLSQNRLGDVGVLRIARSDRLPRDLWLALARNRATASVCEMAAVTLADKVRKAVL